MKFVILWFVISIAYVSIGNVYADCLNVTSICGLWNLFPGVIKCVTDLAGNTSYDSYLRSGFQNISDNLNAAKNLNCSSLSAATDAATACKWFDPIPGWVKAIIYWVCWLIAYLINGRNCKQLCIALNCVLGTVFTVFYFLFCLVIGILKIFPGNACLCKLLLILIALLIELIKWVCRVKGFPCLQNVINVGNVYLNTLIAELTLISPNCTSLPEQITLLQQAMNQTCTNDLNCTVT